MKIFIKNPSYWLPTQGEPTPKIAYAPVIFKRRLSPLTKMTIEVLHALFEKDPNAKGYKDFFSSIRGEMGRQFLINKSLIVDSEILPADFSLSVFNTPIAQAAIFFTLKAGYTVINSANNKIGDMMAAAAVAVNSGDEKNIVFVYADEPMREEYASCKNVEIKPGAFACVITAKESFDTIALDTSEIFVLDNLLTLQNPNI